MKYLELIEKNRELGSMFEGEKFKIHILSNIVVNELKNVLEYNLRINNLNVDCFIADYDNIIQSIDKSKKAECIIIFWELSNIFIDILHTQDTISDKKIYDLEKKFFDQIDYIFENLKNSRMVIFNKFSLNQFNNSFYYHTKIEKLCSKLNNYLNEFNRENFYLIDLNKIFNVKGLQNYINNRDFHSLKILYKYDFYKDYVNHITPLILSNNGKTKKVVVLDCDNTLWPGILGEDGAEKIVEKMKTPIGFFFREIHKIILNLYNEGVILCLCSKNNEQDVLDFVDQNSELNLNSDNFLIKKINWKNKHDNIFEISKKLNLSLDSFVFVDDSEFEVNLITEKMPEVKTFLVPKNINEYPIQFLNLLPLFYKKDLTKEDKLRNISYTNLLKRENSKGKFSNIEDYLKSLNMNISIHINDKDILTRMSQMTQKTNQFNLTTKRYTEKEISNFLEDKSYLVIAISVNDNFGDFGVTGLCIIKSSNKDAFIDTLLLSCRILGRNIEKKFLDIIVEILNKKNIVNLRSEFLRTLKNQQVEKYYDENNFIITASEENKKEYMLEIKNYVFNNIYYIKIDSTNE